MTKPAFLDEGDLTFFSSTPRPLASEAPAKAQRQRHTAEQPTELGTITGSRREFPAQPRRPRSRLRTGVSGCSVLQYINGDLRR